MTDLAAAISLTVARAIYVDANNQAGRWGDIWSFVACIPAFLWPGATPRRGYKVRYCSLTDCRGGGRGGVDEGRTDVGARSLRLNAP